RHGSAAGSDIDDDDDARDLGVAAGPGMCEAHPGEAELQFKASVDVRKSPADVTVERGSGGGDIAASGQADGGAGDVVGAAGAAAVTNGGSCRVIAMKAMEAVVRERPPRELEGTEMMDVDDAYFQAIYDAEMAEQADVVEEAEAAEGAVADECEQQEEDREAAVGQEEQEPEEEGEEEEDGEMDDENYIGVFRSLDERRPLQRHLYGLLAAAPSGAANGGGGGPAAAVNSGSDAGAIAERADGACGGALSTAGCSQVIPSFAFSRRLTAPRLYWGSQYQAQVPPPPPCGSTAAAAALRR
ncbi:hypothetical protein Vretimale_8534, partial [Volvox reticuliferus]